MSTIFFHVALLICALLLLVTFLTYAAITILSAFIIIVFIVIFSSGCEVFSIVLLFCEIHVIFLIYCLALSWVRFDSTSVNVLSGQAKYAYALTIVIVMIVLITTIFGGLFSDCSAFSNLPSFALATYVIAYNVSAGSVILSQYISATMLILHTFEFFIINIFMFLAIILYVAIQKTIARDALNKVVELYSVLKKNQIVSGFILRAQKQNTQLSRSTASSVFVKKTNKYKGDGRLFKLIKKNK